MKEAHKKMCKGGILITFSISIMLNIALLVNLFSLEKIIEIDKPSIKISPPLRALNGNKEGKIYEVSTGTKSRELKVINVEYKN